MGQDYSYSQPSSSSDEFDITSLLKEEAQLYADEAQISYTAEPVQYSPDPDVEDGIPTICYCGAAPDIATSYTPKDPGRRYYTCANVDDGDCHVWKWWDVAVLEEMREFQTQQRQLKEDHRQLTDQVNEIDKKLVVLEKTVCELSKKTSGLKLMVCLLLVLVGLVFLFLSGVAPKASNERVLPHEWM